MPESEWWGFSLVIPGLVFGGYLVLWSIPAVLILAILALNDIKRIEFIDQQLAKDVKKLHSRLDYQLSYKIVNRFTLYCVSYPIIRHRQTTNSWKFRAFMWYNFLGFWSLILSGIIIYLAKFSGVID
ncbi:MULTISPECIES: hypothetical protein [unclassified Salinivibrio]|uniref:hypothetical protein n=1 Tax=unclassified Salinivibrio TaxID=2636825 RepID=UPI00128BCE29|nr:MULTISPECIES: hypothetical protein [unclassified Salinivibrio]MPS31016.1 hypothetical protein [Salinivibrio sp. VYel7]MPX92417.1 hypothetical protein [Salinivibrio sp. VYel9]MPX97673.1 hypothetical protein [Salinivibrio sp. VYel6]MPX98649.1 hypothetical protein [Salinivibrio sp. VYel4]MPY01650.1 hypothetical protein [Salinivibrio sp. VYel5]